VACEHGDGDEAHDAEHRGVRAPGEQDRTARGDDVGNIDARARRRRGVTGQVPVPEGRRGRSADHAGEQHGDGPPIARKAEITRRRQPGGSTRRIEIGTSTGSITNATNT